MFIKVFTLYCCDSASCYTKFMADKPVTVKPKFNIADYNKGKDLREKKRSKLVFPTLIKVLVALPVIYFVFLIVYFLTTAKNLPEF